MNARPPRSGSDFAKRVHDVVRCIPPGRIVSYGDIAARLGRPRGARGVGYALNQLPMDTDVPWWRVVSHKGSIVTSSFNGKAQRQRALLESEGVSFGETGRASWADYRWDMEG